MDQTPLPFVLEDGKTYDKEGVKEVWTQSGQSSLDKRRATVQLKVFDRVRPTVIFRGKSLRKSAKGQIKAKYQEKASFSSQCANRM